MENAQPYPFADPMLSGIFADMFFRTKKSNPSVLLFLFIFLLPGLLPAQNRFDTLTLKLHEQFLRDSLPGLAVVLVNQKGIIYQHHFGYANVQKRTPYTSTTIQNIGSVSKTCIAVAIMKAVELHFFTLDTRVNELLPFKLINPNDPEGEITIRQLCNHTSGIIDNPAIYPNSYRFYPTLHSYDSTSFGLLKQLGYQEKITDTSMKEFFYNYLCKDGKYYSGNNFGKGKTGSTSAYSNIGSALAAYLIELKSGYSYAEFANRYILQPLKMSNSGWSLTPKILAHHAIPYYDDTSPFPFYTLLTYPDGGLQTCSTDLARYLIAIIRGRKGARSILSPASFQMMFTPQFSENDPPQNISLVHRNKGIFWNLYTNGTIGHDGDDPGVSSFLFFNDSTGIGGLFLCNRYLPNKQPMIELLEEAAGETGYQDDKKW